MSESQNRIGQDFTTMQLFKFVLPAFFTNLFNQIFKSLDDALFVSRYVGQDALAGLNILNPVRSIHLGLGHLFSLGSSNISAKHMGQNDQQEAKRVFSRVVLGAGVTGILFALLTNVFAYPLLTLLGADETLASYSIYQIRIVFGIAPITLITSVFNAYYSTAGKPQMGTLCSIVSGTTNIVLDIILIAILKMGIVGACIATAAGDILIFIIGLCFYTNKNNEIYFVDPVGDYFNTYLKSFEFALPQFINNLSISITTLYTNHVILSLIGNDGVAANAIISDVRAIISSGLVGMAASCGPVVSYNFGSKNTKKLKDILTSILKIWFFGSFALVIIGFVFRKELILLFMNEQSTDLFFEMALFGLSIEILAVPLQAGCVTASRTFIALTNTKASVTLSLFRHLIGKSLCLFILPKLFNVTGIWLVIPVCELFAFMLAAYLLYKGRDDYGYGKSGIARKIDN